MRQTVSVQTVPDFSTIEPGKLRIITSDLEARPMSFWDGEMRAGYEPALTRVVCDRLNLEPVWFNIPLKSFYPELSTGQYDVVWFNQTITQERRAWADFTRPYGRFDTGVLVREDSAIHSKADLSRKRLGMLNGSISHALTEIFPPDIEVMDFEATIDVDRAMLSALRNGTIDAIVEDLLVLMAAEAQDPSLRVAFEIPTQRPFGVGVLPGNRELLEALNTVLNALITDGSLAKLWGQWIPYKPYPF